MTFIGLFNLLIVVAYVAFHAAGGSLMPRRQRRRDAWRWLAVVWGLQAADVVTTMVAFGIFDPSIEANHLAAALGPGTMAIIKLILVPAVLAAFVSIVHPNEAVAGLRLGCFISVLAVVSNTTSLMEIARYLLLGYRFP